MRRRPTSIFHDTRGAAYTEAVIVIPVLALLWGGVVFTGHSYHAKSVATQQARRCAWAYANGGCSEVPEGCEGVVGDRDRAHNDEDLDAIAADDAAEIREGVDQMSTDEMKAGGGLVASIVGSDTTAVGSSPIPRPQILGGGNRSASSQYRVMCNEKEKTLGGIVKKAFSDMVGGIF